MAYHSKIPVTRNNGCVEMLDTKLLVPGDIVLLVSGTSVPADIEWLSGDKLFIEILDINSTPTTRITTSIPDNNGNRFIPYNSVIKAGECYGRVRETGKRVYHYKHYHEEYLQEMERRYQRPCMFDREITRYINYLLLFVVVAVFILYLIRRYAAGYEMLDDNTTESDQTRLLSGCMSILLISALSILIPSSCEYIRYMGIRGLIRDSNTAISRCAAIDDIADMSIVCVEDVGTVRAREMVVKRESVWWPEKTEIQTESEIEKERELALYAALATKRSPDDPVHRYFDSLYSNPEEVLREYVIRESEAFAKYVRVTHKRTGDEIVIVKSNPIWLLSSRECDLPCISRADDEKKESGTLAQWKTPIGIDTYEKLYERVRRTDELLVSEGYGRGEGETVGVCVRVNSECVRYVGIIPLYYPVFDRESAAMKALERLTHAGLTVKIMMSGCTHKGAAQRMAKELGKDPNRVMWSRDIGHPDRMGEREAIPTAEVYVGTTSIIDKQFIIQSLTMDQGTHGHTTVGIVGDIVKDSPVMSLSHCVGITRETIHINEREKHIASIIIQEREGDSETERHTAILSAIFDAVITSRTVCEKVRHYVTAHLTTLIHLVLVLTVLMCASSCAVNPSYILVLGLTHEGTLLLLFSLDNTVSRESEIKRPSATTTVVREVVQRAIVVGVLQTVTSMVFVYVWAERDWYSKDYSVEDCDRESQSMIWLQLCVSVQLCVLMSRLCVKDVYSGCSTMSRYEVVRVVTVVLIGCIFISMLAGWSPYFGNLSMSEIVLVWVYDIIVMCLVGMTMIMIIMT